MSMDTGTGQKIKSIYATLPQRDCGFCGFDSCGKFARAIAEGRASPFGCKQNPMAGYAINEILRDESSRRQPQPVATEVHETESTEAIR